MFCDGTSSSVHTIVFDDSPKSLVDVFTSLTESGN